MTFLHPEFLVWMLPGLAFLFYFWQTQKSLRHPHWSEEMQERLHAPQLTMGLKGRNILFLIASVFIVIAMAQPVILQNDPLNEGRAEIIIAIDLSQKTAENFEAEKQTAIDTILSLSGENIALLGYDEHVYRISPATIDVHMLVNLLQKLDIEVLKSHVSDVSNVMELHSPEAIKIIIGDPYSGNNTDLLSIAKRVEEQKSSQKVYAHIPLFYYPLGSAMLLIWIALSSMSKRQSVPMGMVLILMGGYPIPTHAGLFDFQELEKGYSAYERGDYRQSIQSFKRYRHKHDSPQIRYNLANAYYKMQEYEKAHYWYQRVYTSDPLLIQRVAYNLERTRQKIDGRAKKVEENGENIHKKREKNYVNKEIEKRKRGTTRLYRM